MAQIPHHFVLCSRLSPHTVKTLQLLIATHHPFVCNIKHLQGFDHELVGAVSDAVSIPVIASSGAGVPEHFTEVRLVVVWLCTALIVPLDLHC